MSINFPNSPTVGQLYPATPTPGIPQWLWDGSSWVVPIGTGAQQLSACKIQRFTASGTYVPTPGMAFCVIEAVGGGGGGGGVSGAATTGYGGGGGGGAGCYAGRVCTAVQIGTSQPITIGAGGAGGTGSGPTGGSTGGTTTVGSLVSASGGFGGNAGYASINPGAGFGGSTGTGDVVIPGAPGITGWYSQVTTLIGCGGAGGSSMFGGGGQGANVNNSTSQAGNAAPGPGGGGSGAVTMAVAAQQPGGAGANGCVVITEYGNWAQPVAITRGYLFGLTLSTAGGSNTFGVTGGVAADSTGVDMLTLAGSSTVAAISKTTAAWAVGNAVGGLDTGTATAGTWYHVFIIKRPDTGVVDVLFSASPTAPTLPTNYTLFRRIGSLRLESGGLWRGFTQIGDTFIWTTPNADYNNNTTILNTTSLIKLPIYVPYGVTVEAYFTSAWMNGTAGNTLLYQEGYLTSSISSVAGMASFYAQVASELNFGTFRVLTDTQSQIGAVASLATGNTFYLDTRGWVDRRGRDA
jgi:hypothetical protein